MRIKKNYIDPHMKAAARHPQAISVTVPKKIESGNKFMWAKWYIYDGYKKGWFRALSLFLPTRTPESPIPFACVTIVSHRKRFLDSDNLQTGQKPIRDFLKRARYIEDDDPTHADFIVSQDKSKDESTTITVTYK